MQDYRNRLIIPPEGAEDVDFLTKSGLLVAVGYTRVVIGGRGPYIEFSPDHIISDSFRRVEYVTHRYFIEYRSNCVSNVKLYYQILPVDYADYQPGKFYLSPFELTSDRWPVLVTPLENGRGDDDRQQKLF